MSSGNPQGLFFSPFLWNVIYDCVLRLPTPSGVSITRFANDITIMADAHTEEKLEDLVNYTVADIYDWINGKDLQFVPEETEAVVISGRKRIRPVHFLMSGQTVLTSD